MMVVRKKKIAKPAKKCFCGDDCHAFDAWLPGFLLTCLSLIALPLNFGLVDGMDWAKAWPLIPAIIGIVLVVKVELCRSRQKK